MASLARPTNCPQCNGTNISKILVNWTPTHYEGYICNTCHPTPKEGNYPNDLIVARPKRNKDQCRKCGKTRGEVPFANHANICITCKSDYSKEYRDKNHEELRQKHKESYQKNKGKRQESVRKSTQRSPEAYIYYIMNRLRMYTKQSSRSKRRNLGLTIDASYLIDLYNKQNGLCAVTKMPMTHRRNNLKSISIDRIDCDIGYLPDNVQLVCRFINLGRGNRPLSETFDFISELRNIK